MNDVEKTIRHLFYTTSSFVHHFKSIGKFSVQDKAEKVADRFQNFEKLKHEFV